MTSTHQNLGRANTAKGLGDWMTWAVCDWKVPTPTFLVFASQYEVAAGPAVGCLHFPQSDEPVLGILL